MKNFLPRKLFCILCILSVYQINAQVKLPPFFSDSMLLQRNKPVAVWGWASAKENVTVSFANQSKSTTADTSGKWVVWLNALTASDKPQQLIIKASNTIVLNDILVGDVWLCSGQSNMEYTLDRKLKKYAAPKKGEDLAAKALTETKPDAIRYLYVEHTLNKQPNLPTKGWIKGNDTTLRYVSALSYFFAKEIYEQTKIPIGIISSSWGGTRIEQWIPDWAYANSVFKDSVTGPKFTVDGTHPGQMFDGMLKPIFPYTVAGILWYQGETDLMLHDMATYPAKVELMLNTWNNLLHDKDLPFYYVQISPHLYTSRVKDKLKHTTETLPEFWEAQTKCLSLKNTGMIVTTDLPDNLADIHPSYKWIVGHRLALVALAKYYGQKVSEYSGPQYQSAKIKKSNIEISFLHIGSGLIANDNQSLTWFTVAGKDGKFVKADALINGNKIIVSSTEVKRPKYVRFAWDETAQPNLFNKEGLPAIPFRTGK